MQTIEQRIEALERSNRRLRAAGVVCGILLVGVLVVGVNQEAEPKRHVYEHLYAKKITIVNDKSGASAVLFTDPDGGHLGLYGQGKTELSLFSGGQLMANSDGHVLFAVGANEGGSGSVETYNGQGKIMVQLTALAIGGGVISTYDGQGKQRAEMGATESGNGMVTTFSRQGKELVSLGATEDGNGMVTTFSGQGKDLVSLGASEGGGGKVTTHNGQGKELVSLGSIAGDGLYGGTGAVTVFDPTGRTKRGVLMTQE